MHFLLTYYIHRSQTNGQPNSYHDPVPCYALAHANHWADRIAAILFNPHTAKIIPSYNTPTHKIHTPLLQQTYGFTHNGIYIDRDTTTFIREQYYQELLHSLATRPDTGWMDNNILVLQTHAQQQPHKPITDLITYHANIWTQALYRDKTLRNTIHKHHHGNAEQGPTPSEQMKQCPYCCPHARIPTAGTSAHLHTQCTNTHLQLQDTHTHTTYKTSYYSFMP